MGFVAAKCTQCNANIEIDDSKEAGICKYCNTAFITEKAINNYTTNHIYNQTFQADVINVHQETVEQLLQKAETYIKLGKNSEAVSAYKKTCDSFPDDYRAYLGLLKLHTNNYTRCPANPDRAFVGGIHEYAKCVSILCKDNQIKTSTIAEVENYIKKLSATYAQSMYSQFKAKRDFYVGNLEGQNAKERGEADKSEKSRLFNSRVLLMLLIPSLLLTVILFVAKLNVLGVLSLFFPLMPIVIVGLLHLQEVSKNRKLVKQLRDSVASRESVINGVENKTLEQFTAEMNRRLNLDGIKKIK